MTAFVTWFKDICERAAATFAVTVLPLLFAGTTINADIATQAGIAGFAAVASFLKTAALPADGFGVLWLDVSSRAAWSAVQAAAGVLTAAGLGWVDPTVWQGAFIAAGAAAASVIKGLIADRLTSHTITPASVVKPAEATT